MATTQVPPNATCCAEMDITPPVARIALAHPPLNIFDLRMVKLLVAFLEQLESRPDISIIIFEGSSHVFSAGVDIKAHVPEQIGEMLVSFHSLIRAIVASRKVTIAKVSGACLGGGAELAAVCDLVYTARDAAW